MAHLDYILETLGANWFKTRGLAPLCCPGCEKLGKKIGTCPKCLQNQAAAVEYLETHPIIWDPLLREYHEPTHSIYKTLPLRMKGEHPFLYYGLELEIEFDGVDCEYHEDDEYSEINTIIKEFNEITGGVSVCETDSSLRDCYGVDKGIEFIFRPMSYAYLTAPENVERLKKGMEYLHDSTAVRNQPTDFGMHCHISKAFFENGRQKDYQGKDITPKEMYSNFSWMFQVFQDEIEKLGGRQYGEWCHSETQEISENVSQFVHSDRMRDVSFDNIKIRKPKEKTLARGNHRVAINSTIDTVEVRVFKSSIDWEEVLSRVELVRNIAHAAREGYTEQTLGDILHYKDNKFLDKYIQDVRNNLYKKGEKLDLEKIGKQEIALKV